MGIDYNCYLGPYIQCKKEIGIGYNEVRSCTNKACPKHGNYDSQRFCGNCGSVVAKIKFPANVEKVDSWKVMEEIDEDLVVENSDEWKDYDVWILNKDWIRKLHFDPKHEEAITEFVDTSKELEQFRKDFDKQINVIIQAYGTALLKWGMILWMS